MSRQLLGGRPDLTAPHAPYEGDGRDNIMSGQSSNGWDRLRVSSVSSSSRNR